MQLDHQFTVPASIDEVWQAVIDPERVAPCMPGATLTESSGSQFRGSVKVKLGPISLLYKGSGEFIETDEQARKVVIKASGKDSRGAGTAAATVTVTLTPDGSSSTHGAVATDLNVTGKPAQFGRGMLAEVGGKILDSFATCLSDKLGGTDATSATESAAGTTGTTMPTGATASTASTGTTGASPSTAQQPAAPASAGPATEPTSASTAATGGAAHRAAQPQEAPGAPIDLVEYAGGSVVKRAAPAVIGVLAVVALVLGIRRKRRHSKAGRAGDSTAA